MNSILHTILLEMSLFRGVVLSSSQCSFWCINQFDCVYYCLLIHNIYIHPFGAQPHRLTQCGCFNEYFFYLGDIFSNTVAGLDSGTSHCPPATRPGVAWSETLFCLIVSPVLQGAFVSW